MAERADQIDPLIGSIPDTQIVIVANPITGKLLRSTFGQMKADIILAFGAISYLDQIIEVPQVADLPQPGAIKTIYVITGAGDDQNKQFRWGGSLYIEFPAGEGDVAAEAILRGNADAVLQGYIDALQTAIDDAQTALQNNINAEATIRNNQDVILNNKISAEANTRSTNDAILQGLITSEAAIRSAADTALSNRIDLKLNIADYNNRYKGKYTTLAALQTAFPTASAGDSAQVDAGVGSNVINYNWDDEEGWVSGSAVGPSIASTDDLTEGATNLYFTAARAQAAVDISNKVDKIGGKGLSAEDYTSIEKAKLAGIEDGAEVNDANTTLKGNTFNGVSQLVETDASGKLPAIDGSQLTNLPASGGSGSSYGVASGTNTYTVALTPTITALTNGMCIRVLFTNGNTGASTINADGLGVKNIYKGPSTALAAGIITAGQIFELYYDGTVWQLGNTQAIPSSPNKVITTNGSGDLQAVNDLIDVNSTTTEATLIAATWTSGAATATGTPGTRVLGTTSNYLYICTGTNTWIRIPAYLDYIDVYLGTVSDSGGVKTSTQMAALYPAAIRGQYAIGTIGKYEYMGMVGWFYFANTITP